MSPHSHVPAEAFKRGFPGKEDRAQDSLEKLIKLGYVQRHPTRGGMTCQISKEGRDLCRTLKEKRPFRCKADRSERFMASASLALS